MGREEVFFTPHQLSQGGWWWGETGRGRESGVNTPGPLSGQAERETSSGRGESEEGLHPLDSLR